ncbi:MAG TPA: DUF1566 domain-containing protein [Leptospiraceae bacterium]|nr:DUF1566 domain-containing protein [Leptospiraceae bacterium]HMW03784.1 DUF1566 domain-containing protein [Leptospiraceae bacterium]HMY29764.1 DUF1566 domain-containing protein [Leptospiraceae bacterium]HMZ62837.1 DUF1566 domain-containing protein [Leptospiraceae bacterium]HNA06914.1 DUF1566 domain-containing protein [Leptospiraceae bacterium]
MREKVLDTSENIYTGKNTYLFFLVCLVFTQCIHNNPNTKLIAILNLKSQTVISYSKPTFEWVRGTAILEEKPRIQRLNPINNDINFQFSIDPELPKGLVFDTVTGTISGKPELAQIPTEYKIKISNNSESQTIPLRVTVYGYLPLKTNQTTCSNNVGTAISCSGTGQDGELQMGREADMNLPTAPSEYPEDYITKDNASGLVWKTCPYGRSGADCNTGSTTTVDWSNAQSICRDLNNANNGNGFAGYKSWRMPTREDLISMATTMGLSSVVSNTYFPNSIGQSWTSKELDDLNAIRALGVSLVISTSKSNLTPIRCVTGNYNPKPAYLDNNDGTISDYSTRLLWQKCAVGLSGDNCDIGSATGMNRGNALTVCNNLSLVGKKWRLPNYNELLTLLKPDEFSNPLDLSYFPGIQLNSYWSSTNHTGSPISGYSVNFTSGTSVGGLKTSTTTSVRCVANMD